MRSVILENIILSEKIDEERMFPENDMTFLHGTGWNFTLNVDGLPNKDKLISASHKIFKIGDMRTKGIFVSEREIDTRMVGDETVEFRLFPEFTENLRGKYSHFLSVRGYDIYGNFRNVDTMIGILQIL